jgi:tRNA(fMet)-specific endonuclease VapC
MMFVLDTSAYYGFNRGDARLKKWFRAENDILVPLMVVGELRAGFATGNKRAENEALLQRFLDTPGVRAVTLTEATTKLFAEIYLSLRRAGKPIGTNDMWIAASALEHDCELLTLEKDFARVADLKVAKIQGDNKEYNRP